MRKLSWGLRGRIPGSDKGNGNGIRTQHSSLLSCKSQMSRGNSWQLFLGETPSSVPQKKENASVGVMSKPTESGKNLA